MAREMAKKALSDVPNQEQRPPVCFYRFPKKGYEKSRREAWIKAVRQQNEDGTPWLPSATSRICNYHFVDYAKSNVEHSPSYVPTIFPEVYRKKATMSSSRFNRFFRRSQTNVEACRAVFPGEMAETEDDEDEVGSTIRRDDVQAHHKLECDNIAGGHCPYVVVNTQEQQIPKTYYASHSVATVHANKDSTSWRRKCGFSGFSTLKESEQSLRDLCCVTLQVFSVLLNMIPDQNYKTTDMPKEDKLALFLMKLKLGISLTSLGALFVDKSTASRAFRYILDMLSVKLERWVFVPPRDVIKDTMPDIFKQHYPNCTFIIDCTEIRTETPGQTDQQYYMYSNYKGTFTLKVLIAIVPNGQLAFVSKVYGGRHSDTFITKASGFLHHVQPGDVILSDKGFPSVRADMSDNGAVLIMPPMEKGGQYSEQDMDDTYRVAQVRIHVERAIQRLKLFNVLNDRVPVTLIPHMNKIIRVCAALVSTQSHIIRTD
ncbi:uncharacterized protein LOC135378593 [Ornithodoros turicata]|uniref:uncharacterized protein LOC135378593 n=1 Tax=Ornithodoros turicata TaxID=34597 RepID=UPI0031397919